MPPSVPKATSTARVNEIDLLRFLAAFSVVLFHYAFATEILGLSEISAPRWAPLAQYGYLGVELFFMISGFVILMTAHHASFKEFVISRIVRLFPAYWFCCGLTFLFTIAIGAPHYSATVRQLLANLTMITPVFGLQYLDGAYWSLLVELTFYGLVGIMMLTGQLKRTQLALGVWLVLSLIPQISQHLILRKLLITDYSAYFVGGAVCYLMWRDGLNRWRLAIWVSAGALAIGQALRLNADYFEPTFKSNADPAVIISIVAVFFIVMLLVGLKRMGAIGRTRWMLFGAVTYPLYLLHGNIGVMLFNRFRGALSSTELILAVSLVMLASAYAVQRGVEKPIARQLKRVLNKAATRLRV